MASSLIPLLIAAAFIPFTAVSEGTDLDEEVAAELCQSIFTDDTPKFVNLLQTHGSDYSNGDCSPATPLLHTAIVFNRLDTVRALVSAEIGGVDVNGPRDFLNSSALDTAIYLGRAEMIDLLFELGARSNQHHLTPLHMAAITGNAETVRRVLAHSPGDVNAQRTPLGITPLHCVADTKRVEAMQEIAMIYEERVLDMEFDEERFWPVRNPPRRWSVGTVDMRAVVDVLVAAGADINIIGIHSDLAASKLLGTGRPMQMWRNRQ